MAGPALGEALRPGVTGDAWEDLLCIYLFIYRCWGLNPGVLTHGATSPVPPPFVFLNDLFGGSRPH